MHCRCHIYICAHHRGHATVPDQSYRPVKHQLADSRQPRTHYYLAATNWYRIMANDLCLRKLKRSAQYTGYVHRTPKCTTFSLQAIGSVHERQSWGHYVCVQGINSRHWGISNRT
ncbi:hypothetical protein FOCG_04655 [Fusarium oxysporum f. sp. radicis-lycopersici 26381]|nr:hypothetical protein FOWG_13485 [Fusarium oxysporum f. sp. lycopersici MN25]EXL57466.1 hypothetical protein FOCG_04655 [Fusarium oxysporum f. sp. radicis-lycopersici 26381]